MDSHCFAGWVSVQFATFAVLEWNVKAANVRTKVGRKRHDFGLQSPQKPKPASNFQISLVLWTKVLGV